MKPTLQELYEKTLIVEVAGAQNYWITPDGELEQVYNHIEYAMYNIDELETPYYMDDGTLYDENGQEGDESEVYDAIYNLGYIRVVEQPAAIYFTYNRSRPPDKTQFMVLYGMAQDKNKNLVDGETQKVIIKNNEVEPDVARNDKLDKMENELQPDFYKGRNRYGENFSKYGLADYTQLIYEGKSGHGDEKAVTNLLKDYINRGLITVKDTKGGWLVKSTDGKSQEAIHKGERAFHYLRRFLKRLG